MKLSTARLILRDFQEDDWRAVHRWAADPEVVRNMIWGPNTEEQTRGFVKLACAGARENPREKYDLLVERNGDVIGAARLYILSAAHREADIGYCLRRDCWGQGYATEAAKALVEWGFRELKLHRISATCAPENLGSARVLEKAGMAREGCLRQHRWIKGRWQDSLLFAVLEPPAES